MMPIIRLDAQGLNDNLSQWPVVETGQANFGLREDTPH